MNEEPEKQPTDIGTLLGNWRKSDGELWTDDTLLAWLKNPLQVGKEKLRSLDPIITKHRSATKALAGAAAPIYMPTTEWLLKYATSIKTDSRILAAYRNRNEALVKVRALEMLARKHDAEPLQEQAATELWEPIDEVAGRAGWPLNRAGRCDRARRAIKWKESVRLQPLPSKKVRGVLCVRFSDCVKWKPLAEENAAKFTRKGAARRLKRIGRARPRNTPQSQSGQSPRKAP